jgi:homoserine dehydrogenase
VKNDIVVLKFGSSVLESIGDLPNAVHEIYRWYRQGAKIVAVVSAIGDTTERLIRESKQLSSTPEPWATAELLATGERTASALLGIALDRAGIPARVVNPREIGLEVSGEPLDGAPQAIDVARVNALLANYPVLIVPGFFGTDVSGRTQLLGRGGSDLTAVFIATALQATRCRLLKDVDGVYESDPAIPDSHPRRFAELSYTDALRVAGKLIQAKAVSFLQAHQGHAEVAAIARPYQSLVHAGTTSWAARPRTAPVKVVLLGLGTVGHGVYQRLLHFSDQFTLQAVLVRDRDKYQDAGIEKHLIVNRVEALSDLAAAVVIDALPGVAPSAELLKAYLRKGVRVISANKALIAAHGSALRRLAQDAGTTLHYAAAVGGATPMLELAALINANDGPVASIAAVLNGTCNFVLDHCATGASLEAAIAQAQSRGFAESDPKADLSGQDALHKLQLLGREGFGREVASASAQALDESVAEKARVASHAGLRLRQVSRVYKSGDHLKATVEYQSVAAGTFFGSLTNEWNGIEVASETGEVFSVRGRGAGRWPTTEAVMADLFEVARALAYPAQA